MKERLVRTQEAHDVFDDVAPDKLGVYLSSIAPYIGWVVVHFNSLEDQVAQCIREAILHNPFEDDRLDVFLSEMMFAGKCRSLIHLYGQLIETGAVKYTQKELNNLEQTLIGGSTRRNEYAHADWLGLKRNRYVRVKTNSKKVGLVHRYKRFDLRQLKADVAFISNARDELETFNERITDQLYGRDHLSPPGA